MAVRSFSNLRKRTSFASFRDRQLDSHWFIYCTVNIYFTNNNVLSLLSLL